MGVYYKNIDENTRMCVYRNDTDSKLPFFSINSLKDGVAKCDAVFPHYQNSLSTQYVLTYLFIIHQPSPPKYKWLMYSIF